VRADNRRLPEQFDFKRRHLLQRRPVEGTPKERRNLTIQRYFIQGG
jgi:hypothetical protein